LYEKDAIQGNANAQNKLGFFYQNGTGVVKNKKKKAFVQFKSFYSFFETPIPFA
jgi:TPR repeat protein